MKLSECQQPWFELQIEYNGRVGCCCYSHLFSKSLWAYKNTPFSINEHWNSNHIKKMREAISNNKPAGTGCEGCSFLSFASNLVFDSINQDYLNARQKENLEKAIYNYHKKNINLDSFPVKWYINFGVGCNINCIMCSQKYIRKNDKRTLIYNRIKDLKPFFILSESIHIIGGEPFYLKDSKEFILNICNDVDYRNVKIYIYTNAVLLGNFIEELKRLQRVGIVVSLDSIGKEYENIRRGANWEKVEENILKFSEIAKEPGRDWTVAVSAIIMKSSITKLQQFVDWCIQYDFPINFTPLECNYKGAKENKLLLNEKIDNLDDLKDIPESQEIFERSISKLYQAHNQESSSQVLEAIYRKIFNIKDKIKIIPYFIFNPINGGFQKFNDNNTLEIHTPAGEWQYASYIHLKKIELPTNVKLKIQIKNIKGKVGLGIVKKDFCTYIREEIVDSLENSKTITLPLILSEDYEYLIIRNVSNLKSVIEIENVYYD